MFVNNHTAVWGSFYDVASGQWGYACCHSLISMSYCTGEVGIEATQASSAQHLLASSSEPSGSAEASSAPAETASGTAEDRRRKAESLFSKKRLGEGDVAIDQSRLAEALKAEKKRKARGDREEEFEWGTGKKKKVTGTGGNKAGDEVTEEDLGMLAFTIHSIDFANQPSISTEAYRMNRRMTEDPMANYVDEEL